MRLINSDSQAVEADVDNHSAQVVQIDNGKHVTAVALCAAFCGLSLAVSVWAAYTARDAATEARLAEYFLLDPHSRTPDEMAAWVKFRTEHEKE